MHYNLSNIIFLIVCILFVTFLSARNRNVWMIIGCACSLNILLNRLVFERVSEAWLQDWYPVCCGSLEVITIGLLIRFAWTTVGKCQAGILVFVLFTHFCLYLDVELSTNLVYDHYETLILSAMAAQLLLGTNGLFEMVMGFHQRHRPNTFLVSQFHAANSVGYPDSIREKETEIR